MTLKITSINRKFSTILLTYGYILISFLTKGQDLKIKLGESTLNTSEQFYISLIVPQNLAKEFKSFSYTSFPEIEGFVKYKTEQIKNKDAGTYEINQYYLPQKTGVIKLPRFILKVGTAQVYSAGKSLTVKQGPSPKGNLFPEGLEFQEEENDFHFQVHSDKTEIYTGEGFTITASLLIGEQNKVKFQLKDDLLVQTTSIARAVTNDNCLMDSKSKGIIQYPEFDSVQIKNLLYKRLSLFQARYFPIKAGDIVLPPVTFHLIKYQTVKEGNIIWWKAKDLSLSSKKLIIKVKELPPHPLKEVVPVGEFQLKEFLNSFHKAQTGKTINYNAVITGKGNMQQVLSPILNEKGTLEFYPAKIQNKVLNKDIEQKTFNYKILPKEPGIFRFSDYFQWVYFNTKSNRYDTLKSAIKLQVTGEKIKYAGENKAFEESFYNLANQQKNNLRSKERDEDIKYFANIVILFMLVSTAILVLKK